MDGHIKVRLPGDLVTESVNGEFTIRIDQPEESGGGSTAPSPVSW